MPFYAYLLLCLSNTFSQIHGDWLLNPLHCTTQWWWIRRPLIKSYYAWLSQIFNGGSTWVKGIHHTDIRRCVAGSFSITLKFVDSIWNSLNRSVLAWQTVWLSRVVETGSRSQQLQSRMHSELCVIKCTEIEIRRSFYDAQLTVNGLKNSVA